MYAYVITSCTSMPDTQSSEAAMLSRVIASGDGSWPKEAAELILQFAFPDSDRERMNVLAAKARAGQLDPQEESELAGYMRVGRFLELIKAKARLSLVRRPSAA